MAEMTLNHESIYFKVEEVARSRGITCSQEEVRTFTEVILEEMRSQYLYQRRRAETTE